MTDHVKNFLEGTGKVFKNYHFNLFGRVLIGKKVHEFRISSKVKIRTKARELSLNEATSKFLSSNKKVKLLTYLNFSGKSNTKEYSIKKLTDKAHFLSLDVYKR